VRETNWKDNIHSDTNAALMDVKTEIYFLFSGFILFLPVLKLFVEGFCY